ncbi:hypothetical protein H072_10577 [Dactylellina haptotyla CBS 200.50]|uniref:Uncharacterized protein n=1 Tax=Dactylellina haptotyla (strain CBS 200.50) TaxID=1284197 RepID=S8A4C1_DACHA|nr:hypothetical protein H072_10577 [Dactylellina haptotyla CBS 200.50]
MFSTRFSLWAVALLTFVTLCTARTVITTQKCTTRYCGYAVPKPYRTTKIVHKTTAYTKVRWKTATKPKYTAVATGTKTVTSQRYTTLYTVTSSFTVYIGTSTYTRKTTITTPEFTETSDITTKTITPATREIPTPAGFVPINDDPDNRAAVSDVRKRSAAPAPSPAAEPEPEPVPGAQQYVSAVTCTKTYLTKTGTMDVWKTTTKLVGTTTKTLSWVTMTYWPDISTVTAKNALTIRTTTTTHKVAFASTTITVAAGTTTVYSTTITTTLPRETNYLACGTRNQGPPVWAQSRFVVAGGYGPDPSEPVGLVRILGNGTAYDCCALCHSYTGPQVCIGTQFMYLGLWGPPCPEWETEDCDVHEPENNMICNLIITNPGPGFCHHHTYRYYQTSSDPPQIISNGPTCNRFKYKRPT